MAIGWLAVLQSVPWAEVVKNAPMVADGAKKLWGAIGKKPAAQAKTAPEPQAAHTPEGAALAALQSRVASLETAVSDLHEQMLASSELIKTLAEQNTRLVERIEANRVRVLWLSIAMLAIGVVAVISVWR